MTGLHTITVDQLIETTINLNAVQDFEVYRLRFPLHTGAIHQAYHAYHNLVLPHIVFEDAHLP